MKVGKKVGPLPVWAWGVLVLAVVAYFFLRAKSTAAAPSAPSTSDQPGQASGAAAGAAPGGQLPPGLDPSIIQGLLAQNSTITQSLVDAYGRTYGGGNYTAATGSPTAPAPTGAASASGETPPADSPSFVTSSAAPFAPISPYTPVEETLPAGVYRLDPPPNVYSPTATGTENPSAALAGAVVPWSASYATTTTSGTRSLSGVTGSGTLVDPSGHVVNAKGARVGGASGDV